MIEEPVKPRKKRKVAKDAQTHFEHEMGTAAPSKRATMRRIKRELVKKEQQLARAQAWANRRGNQ